VAAAFSLSYQGLTDGQQQMFRRLGLHPGADFDARAAAALDDSSPAAAGRHLEALYDQHLIAEPARGRYRFHDLIRDYAGDLAATDDPDQAGAATGRLLDYYERTANRASTRLARFPRPGRDGPAGQPPGPPLNTAEEALAWLRA
jgi:DNA-binding transcriptional ArsR family regulator